MEIEILAPAGGEQSANAALRAGADAIYLGFQAFSARESAENFTLEALRRTTTLAHLLRAKVYVCLNTLVKDEECARFFECARLAYEAGADAILIQDIFLGKRLKEVYPELTLHLSTQAGCCNEAGALLAKEYGFSRVVLARETPLSEIKKITKIIETEAFVQGALCTAFSGQCYFSSFAGGNSGNRGRCKQPCRKRYQVNRKGFEEYAYLLSTSDLCLGERVKEYLEAGVTSLKIEGRMRREEYVAAAVKYYRALLSGEPTEQALSHLKRAYNRGDYTHGLAFGQERQFLSQNVVGHIGERVGELSLKNGKYYCKTKVVSGKGDGFKILRAGKEIGGAAFLSADAGGLYLASSNRLCAGDEVRITTSRTSAEEALRPIKFREITLSVRVVSGEYPVAECEGFRFVGEQKAEAAKNAPLTQAELIACFEKTELFAPNIEAEIKNAFMPKSALNAFRRGFYEGLAAYLTPRRASLPERGMEACVTPVTGNLTAVITDSVEGANADIVIYKPRDYRNVQPPERGREKYLWLPPLLSAEDEALAERAVEKFDGVYCEGTYGVLLAKQLNKPLFAGIGFNLCNRFAVEEVKRAGAKYFVLSQEISQREQAVLAAEGGFSLVAGGIKLMELNYCPFSATCSACDKRAYSTLTDEEGRKFPLRRYRISGEHCRFEVYNCAPLFVEKGLPSALIDCTAEPNAYYYYRNPALAPENKTRGHALRSML